MEEDVRVIHSRLGKGIIIENMGDSCLVKFDSNRIRKVHTRLLKEYAEPHTPIQPATILSSFQLKKKKLHDAIINLIKDGKKYVEISKILRISPQSVNKIAKKHGIDYMKDDKNRILALIEVVKTDIAAGLKYEEIVSKHNISTKDIKKMGTYHFNFSSKFLENRNVLISDKYKSGQIARTLTSPEAKQIKLTLSVYKAVTQQSKFYRFPNIKRGYKGLFEKKEIVALILKLKKKGLSCSKIAAKLNEAGHKTINGFDFKWHHVFHIQNKSNKRKSRQVKITY